MLTKKGLLYYDATWQRTRSVLCVKENVSEEVSWVWGLMDEVEQSGVV